MGFSHRETNQDSKAVALQANLSPLSLQGNLYPVDAEPIIAESARKHGVSDEDIHHAYSNPVRVFELDEGFTMVIGANRAAIITRSG